MLNIVCPEFPNDDHYWPNDEVLLMGKTLKGLEDDGIKRFLFMIEMKIFEVLCVGRISVFKMKKLT